MSKTVTTLTQIANIKEFINLLSINHQILFILHLFLISYISLYIYIIIRVNGPTFRANGPRANR